MPFAVLIPILITAVISFAVSFAINTLVGLISKAFIKKPGKSPLGFDDRTLTVTGSIQPRQYVFGENRVGGTVVFINRSLDNADVWLVIALAGQQIEAIGDCYINNIQIAIESDGSTNDTTYSGKITVNKYLGTLAQTADPDLMTALPTKWTSAHILTGCAYVVVQLVGFVANWTSQVPNLSFDLKGANEITDTRTNVAGYSDNPAYCIRHWLMNTAFGLGEVSRAIDESVFIAAANICDQSVNFDAAAQTAFQTAQTTTFGVNTSQDRLATTFSADDGTAVTVSTTGSLPSPLLVATTYYFFTVDTIHDTPRFQKKLATSFANAIAHVPINITTGGSGTNSIVPAGGRISLTPVEQTVTVTTATNVVNLANAISPKVCVRVIFSTTGTMPAPLVAGTIYYTLAGTPTTLQLNTSANGAIAGSFIDITTAGTGTLNMAITGLASTWSASATTDLVTLNSPQNIPAGTVITISSSGGFPEPLASISFNGPLNVFWIPVSSTTGRIALTADDARLGKYVDFTTTGTGPHLLDTDYNPVIEMQGLVTGDVVQVSSDGSLPTGLTAATDNCWIRKGRGSGEFAATLADALAGTAISVSGAGTDINVIQRMRQRRYTCNGVFDGDQSREDVLKALLTSCGGFAAPMPKWAIYPASYRPPLYSLTLDDVRTGGVIELTARNARRETFNTVTGVYVTPENFDEPASFPAAQDPDALNEDDGDVLAKDITLPFTNNKQMAIRLARIELNRARLQNSVSFPANLAAYPIRVGATVDLTIVPFGWNKKVFECMGRSFKLEGGASAGGDNAALLPAIDLTLRETNPNVYR